MSILEYLLGPAAAQAQPGHARHLVVDNDVRLRLAEEVSGEHMAVVSCPGQMPEDDWLRSLDVPWRVDAEPMESGGQSSVCVEPRTGRTLLVSRWSRADLTRQAFEKAVSAHVAIHRTWQALLQRLHETQGPEAPIDD